MADRAMTLYPGQNREVTGVNKLRRWHFDFSFQVRDGPQLQLLYD